MAQVPAIVPTIPIMGTVPDVPMNDPRLAGLSGASQASLREACLWFMILSRVPIEIGGVELEPEEYFYPQSRAAERRGMTPATFCRHYRAAVRFTCGQHGVPHAWFDRFRQVAFVFRRSPAPTEKRCVVISATNLYLVPNVALQHELEHDEADAWSDEVLDIDQVTRSRSNSSETVDYGSSPEQPPSNLRCMAPGAPRKP